MHFLTFEAGNF